MILGFCHHNRVYKARYKLGPNSKYAEMLICTALTDTHRKNPINTKWDLEQCSGTKRYLNLFCKASKTFFTINTDILHPCISIVCCIYHSFFCLCVTNQNTIINSTKCWSLRRKRYMKCWIRVPISWHSESRYAEQACFATWSVLTQSKINRMTFRMM